MQVADDVKQVIAKELKLPVERLTDDTKLGDLGAESLDVIEIVFALEDMAEPFEPGVALVVFQPLLYIGMAEVDPANDTFNKIVLRGQLEEIVVLLQRLINLDEDAAIDPVLLQDGLKVAGQEIPLDGMHLRGDPAIADGIVFPKMLVGIYFYIIAGHRL